MSVFNDSDAEQMERVAKVIINGLQTHRDKLSRDERIRLEAVNQANQVVMRFKPSPHNLSAFEETIYYAKEIENFIRTGKITERV